MNYFLFIRRTILLFVLAIFVACVDDKAMTETNNNISSNKQIVEKLITAINEKNVNELGKFVTDNFVNHSVDGKGIVVMAQTIQQLANTFPDIQFESKQILSEGNMVAVFLSGKGTHEGPFMGVRPSGRPVNLQSINIFRIQNGKIAEQWTAKNELELLQHLTGPYTISDSTQLLPVEILASFKPPVFLESILVNNDGSIFVTDLFGAKIHRIHNSGDIETIFETNVGRTPMYRGVICITPAKDDQLFVTINAEDPKQHGVWLVDKNGKGKPFSILPHDTLVNGIARHPNGDLLVADSSQGKIWRIDSTNGSFSPWIEHDLLSPRQYIGQFPGANGIQTNANSVYVSNSDKGLILRIPVLVDGNAGQPEIIVNGLGSDDFAVAEDGTLYVATHVLNSVVRVSPDGTRQVIASPDNGLIGPTAAFLHIENSINYLYVVTDGGMSSALSPVPGEEPIPVSHQKPVVARIKL